MQDNKEKVIEIITEQIGVDRASVKPESDIKNDLGANSLDFIEICMLLEDEFGIEINDQEACEKFNTVQDIIDYINEVIKSE
jgi:acyl carrier protein